MLHTSQFLWGRTWGETRNPGRVGAMSPNSQVAVSVTLINQDNPLSTDVPPDDFKFLRDAL